MDKFLKRIENSERNNPLLKAALEEVERLNKQIDDIRVVVDCVTLTEQINDGPIETVSGLELCRAKVDVINSILY